MFARLEKFWVVVSRRRQPHRAPARCDQRLGLFDHFRPRRRAGGGEGRDAVTLFAAQQLMDRNTERLALDVVQGDVDRRDRRLQHATALEILAAIELLPDRADQERIAADEKLGKMLERAGDRALASREPAFAPAEHAFIRFDLHQQLIADADPGRIGANGADFHGPFPPAPI